MSSYFLLFHVNDSNSNVILKKFSHYNMCKEYVEELSKVNINGDTVKINDFVVNVDNNIMDGYYIVKNNKNRYDLILKKTDVVNGYLFNSANIGINKIGYFDILNFVEEKFKPETNSPVSYNDVMIELKKKYKRD